MGEYPASAVRITIAYSAYRGSRVRSYDYPIWGPKGRHTLRDPKIMPSPALFGVNVAGLGAGRIGRLKRGPG